MAEKKTATKASKSATKSDTGTTPKKKAPSKKVVKAAASGTQEGKPLAARACKVDSCKRGYRAKGYCAAHYKMWRQGKFGTARYKTCNDKGGCRLPMATNRFGYCETHFQNYYVKGIEAPEVPAAKPAKPAKTEEKVA